MAPFNFGDKRKESIKNINEKGGKEKGERENKRKEKGNNLDMQDTSCNA